MPSSRLTDLVSDGRSHLILPDFPPKKSIGTSAAIGMAATAAPLRTRNPVWENHYIVGLALFRWLPEFRNSFTGYAVLQRSTRFFPADSPNLDE